MNKIQSKSHRIGTYEINKLLDHALMINILNHEYDELAAGYQS